MVSEVRATAPESVRFAFHVTPAPGGIDDAGGVQVHLLARPDT